MNNVHTINASPKVGVAQHVLRRLAARGLKVIERHRSKHGSIDAHVASFVPVATRYIEAFDRARSSHPYRGKEVAEAAASVQVLRQTVLAWAVHLERDIEGIELGTFKRNPLVADDVIEGVSRLLETLAVREASEDGALPYAETMVAEIEEARDRASKERGDAQDLLALQQEEAAKVRVIGAQMQAALVGLRRTLRAVLGSSHRDYQKLRQIKARTVDEEDLEVSSGDAKVGDEVRVPAGEVAAGVDVEELEDDGAKEVAAAQ